MKAFVVYKILNIINGLFYIGSTSDFHIRKTEHLGELRTNSHCNKALQCDFNRYGERAFIFSIIQDGFKSRQEMLLREYAIIVKTFKRNYNVDTNCPIITQESNSNDFHKQFLNDVVPSTVPWRVEGMKQREQRQTGRNKISHPSLDKIAERKAQRERFKPNDND